MSPRTLATLLPPSVTWSMPTPIWIGMAGRKAPPASSAILRMAAAGGGRPPSPPASARSRSICRPDSTPSKRGCLPNLKSATPVSLSPCSSEPYWNSNCCISADAALALILPLTRQGWVDLRGAARGDADRPRQAQGAVEFRRAAGERQHAVGFDAERMIDRIDIDMELERAVVGIAAGGRCGTDRARRRR